MRDRLRRQRCSRCDGRCREIEGYRVRTDVLNDDIGRVAPAADCNIAVWEGESCERRCICAPNHFNAGACGVRERGCVEGVDPLQVGTDLARDPLLSLCRAIDELRSKGCALPDVDAKRRRGVR